jgi:predicted permease
MIGTYIKIAMRNLLRHKQHAILNILGLSTAMASCLVIFLVLRHETSYNKYLKDYKQLYHLNTIETSSDGQSISSGTPFPAIDFLRKDFPQYKFGRAMIQSGNQITIRPVGNKTTAAKFYEGDPIYYLDSNMLSILDLKYLLGSEADLREPSTVAISRSHAEKYFGDYREAIGRRLRINLYAADAQVGAVFEDIPFTSDFPMFMAASYEFFKQQDGTGWPLDDWGALSSNHQVYVKIPDATAAASFKKTLYKYYPRYDKNSAKPRLATIRPASSIHFDEEVEGNGDHVTRWSSIYTLAFVGLLILIMACINFVNLSTALSLTRNKEIGVRKVLGSSSHQVRWQMLAETGVLVVVSMLLAWVLAWLTLPYIKHFMAVQSPLSLLNTRVIVFSLALMLITVLLAGIYPAFFMSRFSPMAALRDNITVTGTSSSFTRRALVTLQFACSQILIVATIISVAQMQFISNSSLGFNKEAILNVVVSSDSTNYATLKVFKQALLRRSDIESIGFGFDPPSSQNSWSSNFAFESTEDKPYEVRLKFADRDYYKVYGLKMAAGEVYAESDTIKTYIVNEAFVKKAGVKSASDAIGKMVRLGGGKPRPITGVVADYKQESLRTEVQPILMMPRSIYYSMASIKLRSSNMAQSRRQIEELWNQYFPELVFQAGYYDEDIENFYQQDKRLTSMYQAFALLAVIISCLGLYGLVSFMVVQKTREVGIRKVLGASIGNIVYLLSKEYVMLVILSFVLAAPVGWWIMQNWLKEFAYKVSLGPAVFLSALLISVLIAFVAVGYKSLKAATGNPVSSLRSE